MCTHTCQAGAHLLPHTLCCMRVLSLRMDLREPESSVQHSCGLCRVSVCSQGHHSQGHRAPCGPAPSLLPLVKLQPSLALAEGGVLGLSPSREVLGPPPLEQLLPLAPTLRHRQTWPDCGPVYHSQMLFFPTRSQLPSPPPLLPSSFSKQISAKSQDPLRSA